MSCSTFSVSWYETSSWLLLSQRFDHLFLLHQLLALLLFVVAAAADDPFVRSRGHDEEHLRRILHDGLRLDFADRLRRLVVASV